MKAIAVVLPMLILAGCQPEAMVDDTYDFDDYRGFVGRLEGAETVVLYEGLPHPMFEGELFEAEKAKEPYQEIDGHAFYEGERQLEGQEAVEVLRLFAKEGNVVPYKGAKACGPYHPDYMAEWTIGGEKFRAHACFSCHEVMAVGPGVETVAEMADVGRFEAGLAKFRVKRPQDSRDK